MSGERRETFAVGPDAAAAVRLASGSVRVTEGTDGEIGVEISGRDAEEFLVEAHGDRIVVEQPSGLLRWGSHQVRLTLPAGSALKASLASADLDVAVALAELQVELASGDVRVGDVAGDVRAKTASGDLVLGDVGGDLEAGCASGDVRARRVGGRVDAKSASGDVVVDQVDGALTVRSASGDVVVGSYAGDDLRATSMSGDVRVGFPAGRTLDLDLSTLSGRVHNAFAAGAGGGDGGDGHRVRIHVKTVSGDIVLRPALQPI